MISLLKLHGIKYTDIYIFIYIYILYMYKNICVVVRGQLLGVSFLLPPCRSEFKVSDMATNVFAHWAISLAYVDGLK